jgi:hypothetical protein
MTFEVKAIFESQNMLKNVFIESCILSALIFGGIYFNAAHLKQEITSVQDSIHDESSDKYVWTHVSGNEVPTLNPDEEKEAQAHVSGNSSEVSTVSPISGADQPPLTFSN